MILEETKLEDCFIVRDKKHTDSRGYFFEGFNQKIFNHLSGLDTQFVQDNQSKSIKGVLRGLHFQSGEYSQAKLVRVLQGKVLDVAVDIRPKSRTFGEYVAVELTEENEKQLFIPRGFAHGFVVLSETAIFFYKCDNYYNKLSEGGIIYNDPLLGINWQLSQDNLLLSEKDLQLGTLSEISHSLIFS